MAGKEKLVILDGMALFHRAYHGMPHLTNSEGVPTNAVYGFATMTLKAIGDLKPDYLVLAWDKSKTSLSQRLKLYPEYKAKRLTMPDDFYSQIPLVHELAKGFGMPVVELDHYEADDIIGTLVKQHPDKHVIIVSNDRDIYQLLDGHVEVYKQMRGMTDTEIFDAAKIKEKYGLEPKQIIDLKSLEGDASDNIPGIAGVGEKTALDLLGKYHDLDGVYAHIDEIPGKLHDRLVEGKETAYLSHKLATIMCDAPVELKLEDARSGQYDRQALHELFRKLDFKSLMSKIPQEPGKPGVPTLFDEPTREIKRPHLDKAHYVCVDDKVKLAQLAKDLSAQPMFAFDTETTSLDELQADLVGMSFSWKTGHSYYVPVGHTLPVSSSGTPSLSSSDLIRGSKKGVIEDSLVKPENDKREGSGNKELITDGQLPLEAVVKVLKPIMENPKIGKIGHNIKYDYKIMKRVSITVAPISFDTMIAAFIINPLGRSRTLDDLAFSELSIDMIPISDMIVTKGKDATTFDSVPIEKATTYAAEDADITWRLYEKMAPLLKKTGMVRLAEETEWPLIPILAEMELTGIELDEKYLRDFNKTISAQIVKYEEKIWKEAGEHFNIASPAQLSRILYEKLQIDQTGIKKGKTGISTAAGELEKMKDAHPIVETILQYRELVKLKTTYVDALPKMISPVDGRVHTSYSQTIAQTGRLSSNNPNLQNIPVRTELGREIRKAFVAPKGRVFVSADYSQFEIRIAAALSKDKGMIKALEQGIDIHQQTAAELYGVPLDEVTKDQRYNAKTVNFGVLYGMSAHGLSVSTGMSREEAAEFIKRYYEVRPQLATYIEKIKADTKKNEYAETLFGRRRPLGEINSNNFQIAAAAERMAINVPIQGSQADIMKLAMIQLDPKLRELSSADPSVSSSDLIRGSIKGVVKDSLVKPENDSGEVKLLLQIHDELICEAPKAKADAVAKLMKDTMEQAYDLGVPIEVETSSASNWGGLE